MARDFPVPWALLYFGDVADEAVLDWRLFLGNDHIIEQLPMQPDLNTPDGTMVSDQPNLGVSLNLNTGIDVDFKGDYVSRQEQYWETAARTRTGLNVTTRRERRGLLKALR